MADINQVWEAQGLNPLNMRVGIHSDAVLVGNMGSMERMSYTVMGDAVNLASRVEALTRVYGVDILLGESTAAAVGDRLALVEVDRVRVKGKQVAVTLFTPLSAAIAGQAQFADEMRLWQLALTSYRLQHWDRAQTTLQGLQSDFGDSPLAGLYRQFLDRTTDFRCTPPAPDWDGAHTFDNK